MKAFHWCVVLMLVVMFTACDFDPTEESVVSYNQSVGELMQERYRQEAGEAYDAEQQRCVDKLPADVRLWGLRNNEEPCEAVRRLGL